MADTSRRRRCRTRSRNGVLGSNRPDSYEWSPSPKTGAARYWGNIARLHSLEDFGKSDYGLGVRRKRPESMAPRLEQSAFSSPVCRGVVRNSGVFRLFRYWYGRISLPFRLCGGGRGIRTPGTLSGTAVFKTVAFNHSAIPPRRCFQ